MPWGN